MVKIQEELSSAKADQLTYKLETILNIYVNLLPKTFSKLA